MRGAAYTEGIETVMDEGVSIRVYSVAKTLTVYPVYTVISLLIPHRKVRTIGMFSIPTSSGFVCSRNVPTLTPVH